MFKRLFDLAFATLGLAFLTPLFALLALAITLDSAGPVFFRSARVGRGGKLFRMFKFRTMIAGADGLGPGITASTDGRVTRVGRVLRRTKLDELPQLINVIMGQMSLVGPRPEDPRYVAHYTPRQRQVLRTLPGMTSVASIRYRHEEELLTGPDWEDRYLKDILPSKLELELDFIQRRTFLSDLGILGQSVVALFRRAH